MGQAQTSAWPIVVCGGDSSMERQQFTHLFTISLTQQDKKLLARLAYERGATMSGFVRKLIRDAAQQSGQPTTAPIRQGDTRAG